MKVEGKLYGEISITSGMPSLIRGNKQLIFAPKWPFSRNLPELSFKKGNRVEKLNRCALNTFCRHMDKVHYAKNMCKSCYMWFGRNKTPNECEHTNATLYARGRCYSCYNAFYDSIIRPQKASSR